MKIHPKHSHLLFAFLMSILMGTVVSGILTALFSGLNAQFFGKWLHAFSVAWPITFPGILVLAPVVQKLVKKLTS